MRILVALLLAVTVMAQAPKPGPSATVKQVMEEMTIPSSTALFNAGLDEPPKDQDWAELRVQANVMLESANLLLTPGRAVDTGDWAKAARMMADAGKAAVQAIEAKDLDKLQLDVSEQILMSCSACHEKYMLK
jgi:cytochrome c553